MVRSVLHSIVWLIFMCAGLSAAGGASSQVVTDNHSLQQALAGLGPGQVVSIAPGVYSGGHALKDLAGRPDAPIVIQGADRRNPPVFEGGLVAFHLARCSYLTIRDIHVVGCEGNGINIDDGGNHTTPSHHIRIENVLVTKIGPRGNRDGIKLSGVRDFVVANSRVIGWGGSAVDMVGCHNGLIADSHFEGLKGFSQRNGVQAKGGSSHIRIVGSFFKNAGAHSVVIGGHTGKAFFRPPGVNYEATAIKVSGNRIFGSRIPVAWSTAHGGIVSYNTIVAPRKAVLRISQDTDEAHFIACREGVFHNNLIIATQPRIRAAKIESGTRPDTFRIFDNLWNSPRGQIVMNLPAGPSRVVVHIDPELVDTGTPDMRIVSDSPKFRSVGADYAPTTE